MKICALLLTAVVVLNSVDKSLQSTSRSRRRNSPSYRGSSSSSESSPSPKRRETSPLEPRFPYLPKGSLIIRGLKFPQGFYYRVGPNNYRPLLLHYDAVLNYEGKIVAVFLQTYDEKIFGIYHGRGGPRVKLTPACIARDEEHCDELDNASYHYYPEFHHFEKPDEIILGSLQAYRALGRGMSCEHTPEDRRWFFDLPAEAHIVRGVQFPEGFFFRMYKNGPHIPLLHHNCEVVVDPSGMIVAVFLGPAEYQLFGIYRGEVEERVKLTHISMEAQHFKLTPEEEEDIYIECMVYKKPPGMYRNSFAECG